VTAPQDTGGREGRNLRRLSVLRRLLGLLRPHAGRFAIATVALLLGSGVSLAYPQAARHAVDLGMRGGSQAWLDRIILLLVAVFAAHAALVWIRHYLMSWLGERVVTDLRGLVVARILELDLSWFHERRTGELVGRLSGDVTVIESVVGTELSMALRNAVQLVGGLVLLTIVSWQLTLVMLAVVPPLVVGTAYFGRHIRRMSSEVQDRLAEASGRVQESFGAIQTVQAFVRETHEAADYRQRVERVFQQVLSLARWRAGFMAVVSTAGYAAVAAILYIGGRRVIAGELSAGDLTAFILYTAMIAAALGGLVGLWGALQRAAGATERLFAIIDTRPAIASPVAPRPLPAGGGAVAFEAVRFAYPSRPDQPVLRDVSLTVEPGQTVALVGPSGAGKSTLVALLLRFHDVVAGAVRFEGIDVRELALAELRRAMALVAQEPVLLSGTIRDNIAFARPEASMAEVERAARDAHADGFIARFPAGYDTLVGERGVKLSGGQKQRIAIARAILADPRVLVLDEATSSLDAESEALVQDALTRLMRGRTTLVIAHRLSTVRDADRIVVLDGGRVCEEGSHESLMRAGGMYRRLVEHQIIASVA
jgi:ABC transporter fused permease/ATP-binding protein